MKKIFLSTIACILALISAYTTTPIFALANENTQNFDSYYYQIDDDIIETPIFEGGTVTVENEENSVQPYGIYSYTVTNVKKTQYNLFYALTNWAQGPCKLSYSQSKSFSISSSLSSGVDVPLDVLTAKLGATIGSSYSVTANEQVQYDIPKGYKGRIVLRYYQIQYKFDWSKKIGGVKIKSGSGSVFGKPYNSYYARQIISLS